MACDVDVLNFYTNINFSYVYVCVCLGNTHTIYIRTCTQDKKVFLLLGFVKIQEAEEEEE